MQLHFLSFPFISPSNNKHYKTDPPTDLSSELSSSSSSSSSNSSLNINQVLVRGLEVGSLGLALEFPVGKEES